MRIKAFDFDFYSRPDIELTNNVARVSFFFIVFFLFVNVYPLFKRPGGGMIAVSVIGLLFSMLMLAWDGIVLISPGHITFNEIAGGWIAYGILILVLSIIGWVLAYKSANNLKKAEHESVYADQ